MNELTPGVFSEEIFWEKEIEFKLSLFTKPQPWLCCQRVLLAEKGDTAQGCHLAVCSLVQSLSAPT